MKSKRLGILTSVVIMSVFMTAPVAEAVVAKHPNEILKQTGFDQNLGAQLPLDTVLLDESGRQIRFGSLLGEKPVVLAFAYYECPMLCTLVLNGLTRALKAVTFGVGQEFDVVVISIDPTETAELARGKKAVYVKQYGRETDAGWHFLTGDEAQVRRLADVAGFKYEYDEERDEYSHPSGIMVVTPEGRLSHYFFGIEYSSRDLKLGIMEASKKRIGLLTEQILLLCFHYDPALGKYTLPVINLLRVLGVLTVVALVSFITIMIRSERQNLKKTELREKPC